MTVILKLCFKKNTAIAEFELDPCYSTTSSLQDDDLLWVGWGEENHRILAECSHATDKRNFVLKPCAKANSALTEFEIRQCISTTSSLQDDGLLWVGWGEENHRILAEYAGMNSRC